MVTLYSFGYKSIVLGYSVTPPLWPESLCEPGSLGLTSIHFKITQKHKKPQKHEPEDSSSESKFGQGGFREQAWERSSSKTKPREITEGFSDALVGPKYGQKKSEKAFLEKLEEV